MTMFREPGRELPTYGEFDVVVVGGGIAGVTAAVAARRQGASVCLIEKMCSLGGLATVGNVIVFLPLCDGMGNQVIGGLPEELLKLSVRNVTKADREMRVGMIPSCWQKPATVEERKTARYRVDFNPTSYLLDLEELVLNEGVELIYDTRFCNTLVAGDRIEAVVVENKSGRGAIGCRTVVDASGDADVCHAAGEATEAIATNVPCGWYYYLEEGKVKIHCLSKHFSPDSGLPKDGGECFDGHTFTGVNRQLLASRQLLRDALRKKIDENPSGHISPILVPTIPTHRMTRRLAGRKTLSLDDMHVWHDDAVGMTGDWRKAGPVYCLPLATMTGNRIRNLIACGRCISSMGSAWDMSRAIPTCTVTGEGAGVAAALASGTSDVDIRALDISLLQGVLLEKGVILDRKLLGNQ